MKKKLSFVFLLLAFLACVFAFSSCNIVIDEHDYGEFIEGAAASCGEDGLIAHYNCSHCGKDFDENKREILDVVIKRTGKHKFVNEVCTGCGLKLVYSKGLDYKLSSDKSYYSVSGIGSCTDRDITIPAVYENLPVKAIDDIAFRRQAHIKRVTVPYTVKLIGDSAFLDCGSLVSVVFEVGSELETIDVSAFESCTSLENFKLPETVSFIGDYAFRSCAKLTSIKISKNVSNIGFEAFLDCARLENITVDSANSVYTDIDGNLYNSDCTELIQYAIGKKDASFEVPDSVKKIGESAFEYCKKLTGITIPNSVSTIGDRAFDNCSNLVSASIGKSVTSIGDYAFEYCGKLESITIPESVRTIGYRAFDNCIGLTNITIPAAVTKIGDYAFSFCTGLTRITVDTNNPNYKDIDGNLYNKDGTKFIQYATGKGSSSFDIPDGVTDICRWVFSGCTNLKNVTIPESVTVIGDYAFEDCRGLESIVVPKSVTRIGDYSFSACISLTTVIIPKSVETFGNYAFTGCSALKLINYRGSRKEWNSIIMGYEWDVGTGNYKMSYNYDGE